MSLGHRRKLKKVVDFGFKNAARETMTEIEVFINTAKAFLDDDEKIKNLDNAFASLRNRVFDISGEESRRLQRYLNCWEVEQVSDELDWVEYRLPDRLRKGGN